MEKSWDELIGIANRTLAQNKKNARYDGYQHYSLIAFDGNVANLSGGCYGNLYPHNSGNGNNAIFADYSLYGYNHGRHFSAEIVEEYLHWWANESFVAPVFITKDPVELIKKGSLFDCKYPGQLVIIGAMGLRLIKSYFDMPKNWHTFKQFIGSDAAIVAAHIFMLNNNLNYIKTHYQTWFTIDAYKEAMKRIVTKTPRLDHLNTLRTHTQYYPLSEVFNCKSQGGLLRFEQYPTPKGERETIRNSFGKVVEEKPEVFKTENMEQWLNEFVKMHMEL